MPFVFLVAVAQLGVFLEISTQTQQAWRLVTWGPQVLWALLAAALLLGLAIGLRRQRSLWWLQGLPYLMVGAAIAVQMDMYGIPPFAPSTVQQADSEALFRECVIPSLWALAGLAGLHIGIGLVLLIGRYYRRSA